MSGLSAEQRLFIVTYWFRNFISSNISLRDISKLIVAYSKVYDAFQGYSSLSGDTSPTIENSGRIITFKPSDDSNDDLEDRCAAFGVISTQIGVKYHWKLKVHECDDINIGIIESKMVNIYDRAENGGFYYKMYGYSYWSFTGSIYNGGSRNYGKPYGKDDIIDVWLDLTDGKKEISFAKNDTKYGVAFEKLKCTEYQLAVDLCGACKLEILSFDMS